MAMTRRQQEVLDFIRRTELACGVGPTTREVQHHFGFRSQTAAVDHINALGRKGALDKSQRDLLGSLQVDLVRGQEEPDRRWA